MLGVLQATLATYLFELRMSLTGRRAFTGLFLAGFPPFLCAVIGYEIGNEAPIGLILTVLLMAIELLALLLWIPTGIYSELEGKNWVFSTSRPSGRTAMLLGKWLSGITWAALVGIVSLSVSYLILLPITDLSGMFHSAVLGIVLGVFVYGAIFSFFSVLALKRAMGLCVTYCLVAEVGIGFLPAVVQKFTAFYHLRCVIYYFSDHETIGINELGYEAVERIIGLNQLPIWGNFLCLFLIAAVFNTLAVLLINKRQLITKQEI